MARLGDAAAEARTDIRHSVCVACGHRGIVWMPARLCESCLHRSFLATSFLKTLEETEDTRG